MNYEEFVQWTDDLLEQGRLDHEQAIDAQSQRALFDEQRSVIETELLGRAVGFLAGERLEADSVSALLDRAVGAYGGTRQLYFESLAAPVER